MKDRKVKHILLTGAGGFIGRSLSREILSRGFILRAAVRRKSGVLPLGYEEIEVGDICADTDWRGALSGIDTVIHAAGRAHIIAECETDPLAVFRRINVEATRSLAMACVKAGVKRFIYLSSVKAVGENSIEPLDENAPFDPQDNYAVSKMEAELVLSDIASYEGLQTVILRLPLVYGPGVKANFRQMLDLAYSGAPLPLAGISNSRSMLFSGNLSDAILTCAAHSEAAGETFFVSDGVDMSTPDIIRMIRAKMRKKDFMFRVPDYLLRLVCALKRDRNVYDKLAGSLRVDISKITGMLGWKPPVSVEDGIAATVEHYLSEHGKKNS